jgi:lipopolysaccharide export LptBFGC system permease protein LptF
MTYPSMNGTEIGSNLANIFVYANSVTYGYFGLFFVIAFFLVVLLGSIFMQIRFSGRVRPEISMLASSFATLGLATILEQVSGILSPLYFFILIGLTILSGIWVALSSD